MCTESATKVLCLEHTPQVVPGPYDETVISCRRWELSREESELWFEDYSFRATLRRRLRRCLFNGTVHVFDSWERDPDFYGQAVAHFDGTGGPIAVFREMSWEWFFLVNVRDD